MFKNRLNSKIKWYRKRKIVGIISVFAVFAIIGSMIISSGGIIERADASQGTAGNGDTPSGVSSGDPNAGCNQNGWYGTSCGASWRYYRTDSAGATQNSVAANACSAVGGFWNYNYELSAGGGEGRTSGQRSGSMQVGHHNTERWMQYYPQSSTRGFLNGTGRTNVAGQSVNGGSNGLNATISGRNVVVSSDAQLQAWMNSNANISVGQGVMGNLGYVYSTFIQLQNAGLVPSGITWTPTRPNLSGTFSAASDRGLMGDGNVGWFCFSPASYCPENSDREGQTYTSDNPNDFWNESTNTGGCRLRKCSDIHSNSSLRPNETTNFTVHNRNASTHAPFTLSTNDRNNLCFTKGCPTGRRAGQSPINRPKNDFSFATANATISSTCFAPITDSDSVRTFCRNQNGTHEGVFTCPNSSDSGLQPFTFPSTQFLGGSVISRSSISTARFSTGEFMTGGAGNRTANNAGRMWSSWTDYSIVSGGLVRGMGSGAAFGYNGGIDNNASTAAQKANLGGNWASGGAVISTRNKQGGGLVGNLRNQCAFSKMTSNNINCNTANTTNSTAGAIGQFADINGKLSRITGVNSQLSTLRAWFEPTGSGSGINATGANATRQNYKRENATCSTQNITLGNTFASSIGNNRDDDVNTPQRIGKNDFHVVCTTGSVFIASNIEYEGNNLEADSTPQVIIFANNIGINANVTRIDAWLIVGNNIGAPNATGGILNTCQAGSGDCAANQLVINAPVFARDLQLNRRYHNMKQSGQGLQEKGCSKNVSLAISRFHTNVTGIRETRRVFNLRDSSGGLSINRTTATPTTTTPVNNINASRTQITGETTFYNDACDIAEPAEIFNLRIDSKVWAYSEMLKRNTQTQINSMQEILPFW